MWKKLIGFLKPEDHKESKLPKGNKVPKGSNLPKGSKLRKGKLEPKSEAELLTDLGSTNKAKQAVAIEELGKLRIEAALPHMVEAMASSDLAVVLAGVEALQNFPPHLVLPLVLPALDKPKVWPPARIREVVVSYGGEAVEPICEALEKATSEARPALLEMLGELAEGPELQLIRAALQGEQRLAAARAVTNCAGRVTEAEQLFTEQLKPLVKDPLPQVRAQALEALYRLNVPGKRNLVAKALLDDDRIMRTRAAGLFNEEHEIPRETWQSIGKRELAEQDRVLIQKLLEAEG